MRNYKFRGWSTDFNKWVYGYACFSPNKDRAAIIHQHGNNDMQHTDVVPESVGEWTGRKGINNIDIYENDINQDKGIVIWNDDDASFCWYYEGIMTDSFSQENEWCEIIGNKFQNPELLTLKQS